MNAATAPPAVAVGVGAGALERRCLAIGAAAVTLIAGVGAGTWIERSAFEHLIAILCHVASRVLGGNSRRRRWVLFCYGFLLLSAVDAVAMYLHLSGRVSTMSPWTIEAVIAPLGLVSIPITPLVHSPLAICVATVGEPTAVSEGDGGLNR